MNQKVLCVHVWCCTDRLLMGPEDRQAAVVGVLAHD